MFIRLSTIIFVLLACLRQACGMPHEHHVIVETDTSMVRRICGYGSGMKGSLDCVHTNMYIRYHIETLRRNITLAAVPSMFFISRGNRVNAGEVYNKIYIGGNGVTGLANQVSVSTLGSGRGAMTVLLKYLTPDIYGVTMIGGQILSPLNSSNIRLYRYSVTLLTAGRAEIVFRPRRYNTQLVSGSVIADRNTGRVIRIKFSGEYDMVRFNVDATMGISGTRSLLPRKCDIDALFSFMGNKIRALYHSVYDNPIDVPDSLIGSHDMALMDEMRPEPLPVEFKKIYDERLVQKPENTDASLVSEKRNRRLNKALFDIVRSNLVGRIKGNFGTDGQGSFRFSPILNPMSVSYSGGRGLTYKLRLRLGYRFSDESDLSLNFRSGYSFRRKQFYFNSPLRWTYSRRHNGYVELEVAGGNRMTNSSIVDQVRHESADSIDWKSLGLDYFKDSYLKLSSGHDISKKWSIRPGLIFHRRSAVDSRGFKLAGRPVVYYSFAPSLELQYRPSGWSGPVFTADYERGVKGIGKADMEYERLEFDTSWRKPLRRLRTFSLKAGGGFYTSKSKNSYFLDYANFRDVNIPGGWNDDWTCEFQMLNSNWYNASEYYIRTNITYESPLMLLSRIPYVGRLMEMERIYVNTLYVQLLHPYIECGYGFTNRYFSMGIFVASSNRSFEGFGCRFGFELFRDW